MWIFIRKIFATEDSIENCGYWYWLLNKIYVPLYCKPVLIPSWPMNLQKKTKLTAATWVVIVVPPAPPMIKAGEPSGAKKIEGLIEDWGLFPGAMKLEGEAGSP